MHSNFNWRQRCSGSSPFSAGPTGNVNRSARTDKNGRYTITFPGGEGDYFVEVAAIGYAARRFELKRTADQEILVADARLLRAASRLCRWPASFWEDSPCAN